MPEQTTIERLETLQLTAIRASYNGNATVELCRVVHELTGIIRDQQTRIEQLLNVPAPLAPRNLAAETGLDSTAARERFRSEHGNGEGDW